LNQDNTNSAKSGAEALFFEMGTQQWRRSAVVINKRCRRQGAGIKTMVSFYEMVPGI
jgi:hypothetical protein